MSDFKDLFSLQASEYAKYRPTYPPELFSYLSTLTSHDVCWDAGCGNGQATLPLAKIFRTVIGTDPSENQLKEAPPLPNVLYKVERAEDYAFAQRPDLITVAQAFHWFDHRRFAEVLKRISTPGSMLAVWGYGVASIDSEVDPPMLELHNDLLGPYWEKERHLVETGYRTIAMPFEEIQTPHIPLRVDWSLDQLLGYFKTWSSMQKYLKTQPPDEIESQFQKIRTAWGTKATRTVEWPLNLRVWKI